MMVAVMMVMVRGCPIELLRFLGNLMLLLLKMLKVLLLLLLFLLHLQLMVDFQSVLIMLVLRWLNK